MYSLRQSGYGRADAPSNGKKKSNQENLEGNDTVCRMKRWIVIVELRE